MKKPMKTLDRHLLQRYWRVASPYWRQEEKWKAWGMLALLVILLLAQTRLAVLLNEKTGEFTSALAAHNEDRFWDAIKISLGLLVIAVPIHAFFYYVRDKLGIRWRRWLTNRFLNKYFAKRHFYDLNSNNTIDNPDQRIAEDISTFTQRSLFFLLILIGSILQLVAFSNVLWSISRGLVYFLAFYAVAGTFITVYVFGKPLIGLNFQQLRREANFRFSLVRVRENAESIALYRGEALESQTVRRRFTDAFNNYNRIIRQQFFLNLFQYAYGMLTIVLPSAIIASQVLSGELEVGSAVQASGAFAAILTAISVVIENFEYLSRFAAGIDRLSDFTRSMSAPPAGRARAQGVIESVDDSRLALENVTLQTPNYERILIRELTLTVDPGANLMIVGASGSGKSSLLRAIAGLWRSGSGRIVRPAPDDLLFLPQQPYMQIGSLRSQLLYPNKERFVSDADLLQLLDRVNLGDLAERFCGLDTEMDWEKVLSVGEQQRLAFARVLLTKPRYTMLDEATSALDIANEERLYRELAKIDTTVISIGHRSALVKFHSQVLELAGNSEWRACPADTYQFQT